MILNWLLKRPIMCLTCSSAKFLSNRPSPFTDYGISEFGCLKRKNRCQAISNFNEKEVWKKPKQTTDMKQSKIRHSEIKKKSGKTTISTFLCFTQSTQKSHQLSPCSGSSPFGGGFWPGLMSFLNTYSSFFSTLPKKTQKTQTCFQFLQMFNSQTAGENRGRDIFPRKMVVYYNVNSLLLQLTSLFQELLIMLHLLE